MFLKTLNIFCQGSMGSLRENPGIVASKMKGVKEMCKMVEFKQHRGSGKVSLRTDSILGFERLISSNQDEMEVTTVIFVAHTPTPFWVNEPYEVVKQKIEQAASENDLWPLKKIRKLIDQHNERLCNVPGLMPRAAELEIRNPNNRLLVEAIYDHGGFEEVAKKLGLRLEK